MLSPHTLGGYGKLIIVAGGRTGKRRTEAAMSSMVFRVPSISCAHCKTAIEREVTALERVDRVEVDVAAHTVRVEGDAAEGEVVAAVEEAGYDVVGRIS